MRERERKSEMIGVRGGGRSDTERGENEGVARWWKLIKHRSNEKSKNNISSNS